MLRVYCISLAGACHQHWNFLSCMALLLFQIRIFSLPNNSVTHGFLLIN